MPSDEFTAEDREEMREASEETLAALEMTTALLESAQPVLDECDALNWTADGDLLAA
jgi:hypothetical protein